MTCEKCGTQFHETCSQCDTAILLGSAFAEHMMTHMSFFAKMGDGGMFRSSRDGKYNSWESPAGNCPSCWHEANPSMEQKAEFTEWVKERFNPTEEVK